MNFKLNADNADLQPQVMPECHVFPEGFISGYVDAVNGESAAEVAFAPTEGELVELAKFWEQTYLSSKFVRFNAWKTKESDLKKAEFASRRLKRIIGLVGEPALRVIAEVREKFAQTIGSDNWGYFVDSLGQDHVSSASSPAGKASLSNQSAATTDDVPLIDLVDMGPEWKDEDCLSDTSMITVAES